MKILILGNPNVGKSTLFSRLTGVNVMVSNYAGTTVEFSKGYVDFPEKDSEIIDVPGTYSINASNKAEDVAVDMIKEGDLIINVIDALNLERNLRLTLEIFEKKKPIIVALNFWDEALHTGIDIDITKLEKRLGVPVIPISALNGFGINKLVKKSKEASAPKFEKINSEERWKKIGKIIEEVQTIKGKKHTFLERLSDLSIQPFSGIIIMMLIFLISILSIKFIGETLISFLFNPLFELYRPIAESIYNSIPNEFIRQIVIGNLYGGEINFDRSLGLLTTGLYVPIAMVLPFVFVFYLVLGVLEDFGYLPRISVLIDNITHKFGMHGFSMIPLLLGLGCNVPGALALRNLESRREKFIVATVMAISVPCIAQLAIIIGLLGIYGIKPLIILFSVLLFVAGVLSYTLNKLLPGKSPELFIEICPYRLPDARVLGKKLFMRMKQFFKEAIPFMFFGVLIVNLLYFSGAIDLIGDLASPVIVKLFGLPKETVSALIVGLLRKDVAVGMLAPLGMTVKQLIIASTILVMYFPCLATFFVITKEIGIKDMAKVFGIMILSTGLVGGALNLFL